MHLNSSGFHGGTLHQSVYTDVHTLSGKPEWACGICGMYSLRKCITKRHDHNLHNGIGNILHIVWSNRATGSGEIVYKKTINGRNAGIQIINDIRKLMPIPNSSRIFLNDRYDYI